MSESSEYLKLYRSKKRKSARAQVNTIEFMNDGYYIVYVPSLNISAYGNNHDEAHSMLKNVVFPDFFETLMECKEGEILKELTALGWEKSPFFKMELSKTAHIDKEGILRDFNLSEETQLTEGLVTV